MLKVCVVFDWAEAGSIRLGNDGRLAFPSLPASGGIYRIRFSDQRSWSVYIGESDNLARRSYNYKNPGPRQRTSIRINQLLSARAAQESLQMATIAGARMEIGGRRVPVDFEVKAVRRLFEAAALVAAIDSGADEIVNL